VIVVTILLCILGVLVVCGALRYQLRSTPTHLVVQRRTPALPPTPAEQHHMNVTEVRRMEWELYGHYLTGRDGRPLAEDDPAAHVKDGDKPKEPEGNPCWCNYCKGRVGVHGADAVALYQAQAKAALDQHRAGRRQVITNVTAGGNVTQVVSAGRNITIVGDSAGVIVTGDNARVVQSFGDDPDWDELGRNMDRLRYDLSRAIDRATRGIFG
jgi:hypothetical protein